MRTPIKITCDQCGYDLTYTTNCVGYYVSVTSPQQGHFPDGGAVTAMMAYPKCGDMDFCDMDCLKKWVTKDSPPRK